MKEMNRAIGDVLPFITPTPCGGKNRQQHSHRQLRKGSFLGCRTYSLGARVAVLHPDVTWECRASASMMLALTPAMRLRRASFAECGGLCVDDPGAVGTPDGTVQDDGCVRRSTIDANAFCPQARDCGQGFCNPVPEAIGGGCQIRAGTPFDGDCEATFLCEVGTCIAVTIENVGDPNPTGECMFTPTDALCDDNDPSTEDICVAGRDPAEFGISAADVDAASGCGYKEAADDKCVPIFSCCTVVKP